MFAGYAVGSGTGGERGNTVAGMIGPMMIIGPPHFGQIHSAAAASVEDVSSVLEVRVVDSSN